MPLVDRPIQAEFQKFSEQLAKVLSKERMNQLESAFYAGALGALTLITQSANPMTTTQQIMAEFTSRYAAELIALGVEVEPCPSPSVKPS